jgi:hypothetical protein
VHYQADHEQDEEEEKQKFRDSRECHCGGTETEERRQKRNDEEY